MTAWAEPKKITGHSDDVPPATYNLTAEVFCPVDTNPANNRREAIVRVLKPEKSKRIEQVDGRIKRE